jgi:AcrR family transcriptional regulator
MKTFDVQEGVRRAAVELFAQNGFANTSVQQVVDRAGVTKGAMYHYFSSKDDLLFGIYERLLTLQSEHLGEIARRDATIHDTLRAACVDVIETSIEFLDEGIVFFRSLHMLSPERRQEVTRRRRSYHDEFAGLIAAGQRAGLYRDDIPLAVLVAHFFSDVHYLPQWYSPSGAESGTLIAEQLTELFLRSLSDPAPDGRT